MVHILNTVCHIHVSIEWEVNTYCSAKYTRPNLSVFFCDTEREDQKSVTLHV